jgi:SAM-dependent MidA family methyltransferase
MIFYNCVAAIKSFRNNEFTQLESCDKTIEFLENQCEPNNILKARVLGVHFLNDLKKGDQKAEHKFLEIDFESWFPDIGDRVTSMFFFFNYLFEAKSFNLMIKLFERWLSQDTVFFSIWTRVNWNQICVYMTYAYLNENKKELAEKYFSEVNISLFEVYNFERFQVLYTTLKMKFI